MYSSITNLYKEFAFLFTGGIKLFMCIKEIDITMERDASCLAFTEENTVRHSGRDTTVNLDVLTGNVRASGTSQESNSFGNLKKQSIIRY